MLSDGKRGFGYDDENQLTTIIQTNQWKSDFVYDGFGRRRKRLEYTWTNSAWNQTNEVRYVYDGMLAVMENDSTDTPQVFYQRGLDLSGGMQGAGGIGGLLARLDGNGAAYYHEDGNGNVATLVDDAGNLAAHYSYDPFGNVLASSGPMAGVNEMQFSSMPRHAQSGLSLYAFRAYSPNLQRWTQRDPIGERGGINLHGFNGNTPVNRVDPYGLAPQLVGLSFTMDGRQRGGTFQDDKFGSDIRAAKMKDTEPMTLELAGRAFDNAADLSFDPNASALDAAGGYSLGLGLTILGVIELIPDAGVVTRPAAKGACKLVDHYALRALEDGFYPVMKRGFKEAQEGVWLNKGDVWKYGTTKNPDTRYSQSFLDRIGVQYDRISKGTLDEALAAEQKSLRNFVNQNSKLPPGNKIMR
jgi:RHS repeat-associated protein